MVIKFSIFEKKEQEPKVGDYVVCRYNFDEPIEFKDFLDSNIGRIADIDFGLLKKYRNLTDGIVYRDIKTIFAYKIRFDNIPEWIRVEYCLSLEGGVSDYNKVKDIILFSLADIEFYSSNKEDCEDFLMAKKYNL